ncbi:hypothetical protein Nepgr_018186 [Nepenthes gracilis]|uniref:PRONE domain-containing protein n=1 Tax=Nepenthes gracilis TaxID=150966 RepID=A0AAD3SSW5_NEPGR|nr:hypothetical protein Nepgr_018186 [Nepenthes gracilis]
MGSVSSEDEACDGQSERYGSYSLSADVSESESSSSVSCRRSDGISCSMTPSTLGYRPVVSNCSFPTPATSMLKVIGGRDDVVWDENPEKPETELSEIEMMKERLAKLLLGEDMSGGGKGVSTALAISNAITNLAASVFGDLWRLEPLAPLKQKMWRREMECLLCVSDSIVELVPSIQEFPGGGTFEVMATQQRFDLYVNLPALKKLDAMLLSLLDGFRDMDFSYVDRGIVAPEADDCEIYLSSAYIGRPTVRQEDKWWLPCPKVPPTGLSEDARKKLQQCKECTNQILKAAVAINGSVLAEMEIPYAYLDSLPKNGKDCLGDIIYRYITAEQFSPECLLDCLDLSSEHYTLEVANRIEAAVHVWRQKDKQRHGSHLKSKRSSWGGKVKRLVMSQEQNQVLAQRAETLSKSLRLRFPALRQTALDMSKIQYNKDVGQAILESYSRVIESVAFNIMARIDDLLFADDAAKKSTSEELKFLIGREGFSCVAAQKQISSIPCSIQHTPYASSFATPNLCFSPAAGSPGKGLAC